MTDPRAQLLVQALADAHDLIPEEATQRIEDLCAQLPNGSLANEEHSRETIRRLELYVAMRRLAKAELTPALVEAGMSEAAAAVVALHIGGEHLYQLRVSGEHQAISSELGVFLGALAELAAAYDRLGPLSQVAVRKLMEAASAEARVVDVTIAGVRALHRALQPAELKVRKGQRPLEVLQMTISASARAWYVGTGAWPKATVKPDFGATAPLYSFYARHAGIPVSKDVFQAGLRDAKREHKRLTSGN